MRSFFIFCTLIVYSMASPTGNDETTPLQVISQGAELFSTKFYQRVIEKSDGNLITSPLSADIVLSMAALGAGGNTKKEMRQVLNFHNDDNIVKAGYQSLIDNLNNVKSVTLKVANKIFPSKSVQVKPEFQAMTGEVFRSASEQLDYSNPIAAAAIINEWCANNTENKIKDLVTPDSLDPSTGMVLVNAVYFKGQWKKKFNPAATRPKVFHISKTNIKKVPTMYQKTEILYGELPEMNAKFVEIPYVGDEVSMIIVLPNEIDGLSGVEAKMENFNLHDLRQRGSRTDVELYLPKFKIESKIDLNDVLIEMGMREMFSDKADFSGISGSSLQVSKVVQKAFIQVDEEGSEAAAATGMYALMSAMNAPPLPKIFNANRPFMYFLTHKSKCNTPTLLFNGKLNDPETKKSFEKHTGNNILL